MRFVYVREGTDDRSIWTAVNQDDEYRLAPLRPEDMVVDIGAHTGAFVARAWKAGSRCIVGFEANQENHRLAEANCSGLEGVSLKNLAVVRSDERKDEPAFYSGYVDMPHELNTGVGNVFAQEGEAVPTIPFDAVLEDLGLVRLLKLDCEGSEWPILYTSKRLERVVEIVGEWHLRPIPDLQARLGLPPCTLEHLCAFLGSYGFVGHAFARREDMPDPIVGNFHFVRTAAWTGENMPFLHDLDGERVTLCASVF